MFRIDMQVIYKISDSKRLNGRLFSSAQFTFKGNSNTISVLTHVRPNINSDLTSRLFMHGNSKNMSKEFTTIPG